MVHFVRDNVLVVAGSLVGGQGSGTGNQLVFNGVVGGTPRRAQQTGDVWVDVVGGNDSGGKGIAFGTTAWGSHWEEPLRLWGDGF